MKTTLELCCGTKSFSKVMKEEHPNYNTITVDNDSLFDATHTTDVLKFEYKTLYPDRNHFDMIWCSPPCTEYSIAKTKGVRDFEKADALVKKCLEIIDYYKPRLWFIENPFTGYLKSREFMKGIHFYKVDYCRYESGRGRKKRTAIWTNNKTFKSKLCEGTGVCIEKIGSKHACTPKGKYWNPEWKSKKEKSIDIAQVPPNLIQDLIHI